MYYMQLLASSHIPTSIFINYAFAKLSSAMQIFERHCAKCIIVVLLMLLIAVCAFVRVYEKRGATVHSCNGNWLFHE